MAQKALNEAGQVLRQRVADVLGRMTLDEKASLLHQYAPALPRVGLPAFRCGTEVLHGVCFVPGATVFPQSVGLGATWNPRLIEQIGAAVAHEVRRLHAKDPEVGLNVWGPVVNLLRDPRWGRNEEGYSEDPVLTAQLAIAYCQGLRGGPDGSSTALKTAPTLKHFLAYNHISDIGEASSQLRPRVLREYDLKPFELTVKSGAVSAVMASYNNVNGRPSHLSPYFDLLRQWQPDLVVIADAFGPIGLVEDSHYYEDRAHAYAAALRAGLDSFTCENENPEPTMRVLSDALTRGLLREGDIEEAAARILRMRLQLDEIDPAARDAAEDAGAHGSLAREAARQSIVLLRNRKVEGRTILPFDEGRIGSICVVGLHAGSAFHDWYSGEPSAESTLREGLIARLGAHRVDFVEGLDRILLETTDGKGRLGILADGDQTGVAITESDASPKQQFDVVDWGQGRISLRCAATGLYLTEHKDGTLTCDKPGPSGWTVRETFELTGDAEGWLLRGTWSGRYLVLDPSGTEPVMSAQTPGEAMKLRRVLLDHGLERITDRAAAADAVVIAVGTHPLVHGGERADRMNLSLPAAHEASIRAALATNPTTAVVVMSGHPVTSADPLDEVPALLWSCHAGQESGNALADILLGRQQPRGRLPQTWYRAETDLGDLFDYDIIKSGKTYLYFNGETQFPFGHGLSYTDFAYAPPRVSSNTADVHESVALAVEVANRGERVGTEVVQLYMRAPENTDRTPLRRLIAFEDVTLGAGESATVTFTVAIADLAQWDVDRNAHIVPAGTHELLVGSSCLDIRGSVEIVVNGEPARPRSLTTGLVRAADFDDYCSIRLVDEMRAAGDAVEPADGSGWLVFEGVGLGAGGHRFVARLRTGHQSGRVDLCLGAPDRSHALAGIDIPAAQAREPVAWHTYEVPLTLDAGGVHDVYVVLSGPIRIASLGLARAQENGDA